MSKNKYKDYDKQIEKKNTADIVGGYDPNASFEDILFSYERTGNPYSLKKSSDGGTEKKEDFGETLSKWENIQKKKNTTDSQSVSKIVSSNKSFGEILSSWESSGVNTPSTNLGKNDSRSINEILSSFSDEDVETSSMFLKEDKENKASKGVSWSVYGGKKDVVRESEETVEVKNEKKTEKVNSKVISSNEDFGATLNKWSKTNTPGNDSKDSQDGIIDDRKKGHFQNKGDNSFEKSFSHFVDITPFEEMCKDIEDVKVKEPTIGELRKMLPQSTLDLHGYTQSESEGMVKSFLNEAKENKLRKIAIITGKGLHSENGNEVIRTSTEKLIKESSLIKEHSYAPINRGGSGVIWIILK